MPELSDADYEQMTEMALSILRRQDGDNAGPRSKIHAIIGILSGLGALEDLFPALAKAQASAVSEEAVQKVRAQQDPAVVRELENYVRSNFPEYLDDMPDTTIGHTLRILADFKRLKEKRTSIGSPLDHFDRSNPPDHVSLFGIDYVRKQRLPSTLDEAAGNERSKSPKRNEPPRAGYWTTLERAQQVPEVERAIEDALERGRYASLYGGNASMTPEYVVGLLQEIVNTGTLADLESIINRCRIVINTYGRSKYAAASSPESRARQFSDNARDIVIESLRREFVGPDTLYDVLKSFTERFVAEVCSLDGALHRRNLLLETINLLDAISEDLDIDEVGRHDAEDLVGRLRAEWSL